VKTLKKHYKRAKMFFNRNIMALFVIFESVFLQNRHGKEMLLLNLLEFNDQSSTKIAIS